MDGGMDGDMDGCMDGGKSMVGDKRIGGRGLVLGDEHPTKGEREKLLAIIVLYQFTTKITCVRYCLVANV